MVRSFDASLLIVNPLSEFFGPFCPFDSLAHRPSLSFSAGATAAGSYRGSERNARAKSKQTSTLSNSSGVPPCACARFTPVASTFGKRKRLCLDDDAANFVYTGQENVPDSVIHVRIHPSVKVIRAKAFFRQTRLMSVELHNGIDIVYLRAVQASTKLIAPILLTPLLETRLPHYSSLK